MRYLMTLIWALLISSAISYVLSSMAGDPFNLTDTFIMAGFFAIIIFIMADGILKQEK